MKLGPLKTDFDHTATGLLAAARGGDGFQHLQSSSAPSRRRERAAGTLDRARILEHSQVRKPCAPIKPIDEVDELISLIYQGPLEEEPWQGFLRTLCRRLRCEVTAMTIRSNGIGNAQFFAWESDSHDDVWREQYLEGVLRRLRNRDPLGNALTHSGSVYTLDDVLPRDELVESEFYRTLMKPYGMEYQLGMCFCEPSGWKCNIGIMNGPDRHNFGDDEKRLFRAFHPHLERALEIYARLRLNKSEKEIFEDTLDRLTIGTFILDGRGNIVGANRSAQHIARRNACIGISKDRIVLQARDDDNRLNQLIKHALAWRENRNPANFVDVLRIEGENDLHLDLLVRAVSTGDRCGSDVSPSVIVYIGDSVERQLAPDRFIAQLFGLTPSEAFLATLLANGFTLADAASKLDVTENTVRSYAKRIFAKTGVTRQADLVRLVLKSVAMLA